MKKALTFFIGLLLIVLFLGFFFQGEPFFRCKVQLYQYSCLFQAWLYKTGTDKILYIVPTDDYSDLGNMKIAAYSLLSGLELDISKSLSMQFIVEGYYAKFDKWEGRQVSLSIDGQNLHPFIRYCSFHIC